MSQYDSLWKYIKENNKDEYKLSFDEVKDIPAEMNIVNIPLNT